MTTYTGTINDDIFDGGNADDIAHGDEGNDTLSGNGGNDVLYGDGGKDTLTGGAGLDILYGGDGDDTLKVADGDLVAGEEYHGGAGSDYMQVDTGAALIDLTGVLIDGIETLQVGPITVTHYADSLTVKLTNAQLASLDALYIGNGTLAISGGGAVDLTGTRLQLSQIKLSDDGNSLDLTGATLITQFSNSFIYGGKGNDVIFGSGSRDYIYGEGGDDVLAPGSGNDLLDGGDGNDRLIYDGRYTANNFTGGTGVDTLDCLNAVAGVTVTLGLTDGAVGKAQVTGAANTNDVYSIEYLIGSNFADTLTGTNDGGGIYGNDGNDTLSGLGGNDQLYGGKGDDTLLGGAGDDMLEAGPGNDHIDGGTGDDFANYANASGSVTVDLTAGTSSGADGNDTLVAIDHLLGSAFADTLTGNADVNWLSGYEGNDTLRGMDGDDALAGGAGQDTMIGGKGNDHYVVDDAGDVVTEALNEGVDYVSTALAALTLADNVEILTFTGTGAFAGTGNAIGNAIDASAGGGDDVLHGLDGGDTLIGGAGADTLYGDDGSDELQGGTGADIMFGGTGDDIYQVDDAGDQVNELAGEGSDTVRTTLNSYTLGANVENLAFWGTGDFQGTGNALANDIEGGAGKDHLYGGDGNDTLVGNDGNDLLSGEAGADIAVGGKGDDFYIVQDPGDMVVEQVGEGHDVVASAFSYTLAAGQEIEELDSLLNGYSDMSLTGNEFGQAIFGDHGDNVLMGMGGNDTLYGNDGNDRLDGGTGADKMTGGAGDDVFIVDDSGDTVIEFAGYGNDTILTAISLTLAEGQDIETLKTLTETGTDPLSLTGNSIANRIEGNAGANILNGAGGADVLAGGGGNDLYIVTDLLDTIIEAPGAGIDRVDLSAAGGGVFTLADNVENLDVNTNSITAHGNAGDNRITSTGTGNTLYGEGGDDTLVGGTSADILAGGSGNDIYFVDRQDDVVFENANEGTDTVISTSSYYLYAHVEKLTLASGAGGIFGVGNDLDNLITGNEGANLILGGAGNDEVHGGSGNDQLYGEAGVDTLSGDAGVDYLIGGDGNDVLAGGNDEDALYGEAGDDVLFGGDDFKTDILIGGDGNDTLRGDSGLGDYDLMDGGAGNDIYIVDTYADVTYEAVGGGTDTVYASTVAGSGYYLYANVENLILTGNTFYGVGNELANNLTGNDLDNWLLGGAGDDILDGKGGNDVLFGQDGADIFVFEAHGGGDTVADFTAGTDRIDLAAFGFTSFAQVQAAMSETGGSTAIVLGNGDFIVLQNVANAALHSGDFILSGTSAAQTEQLVSTRAAADTDFTASRGALIHEFDAPHLATLF